MQPADLDLIRRERALPGLGAILDGDALVRHALGGTAGDLRSLRCTYLRYKPAESCLALYVAELGETRATFYAKAFRPDADEKLAKALRQRGRGPEPQLVERSVVVTPFPGDRQVRALARLFAPGVRSMFPEGIRPSSEPVTRLLAWKPERRCVASVSVGGSPRMLAKGHTAATFDALVSELPTPRAGSELVLQRLLGTSERHQAAFYAWHEGRLLGEAIRTGRATTDEFRRVGAALADLHGGTAASLRARRAADDAASLAALADDVGGLAPSLAPRLARLSTRLAASLVGGSASLVPTHGDFYAKQVLLRPDAVVFLDFDEVAFGEPLADVGLFVAHLERDAMRGLVPWAHAEEFGAAFVDGYAERRGAFDARELAMRVSEGLLRLTPHPFRHREDDWMGAMEAILSRAEQWAGGGTRRGTPRGSGGGRVDVPRADAPEDLRGAVLADPGLSFVEPLLDPTTALHVLRTAGGVPSVENVIGVRLLRHKRGRRCLLQLDVVRHGVEGVREEAWIAKVRARGADERTARVHDALWSCGFDAATRDGCSVPRSLGVVPAFRMTLQQRVGGRPLLSESGHCSAALGRRLARLLHKLHAARVSPGREHTAVDELLTLETRLAEVAETQPWLAATLDRIASASRLLVSRLHARPRAVVHRDLHPSQVLVDGERLWLVDLDLMALGDPAVDAGNFLAHLVELGVRAPAAVPGLMQLAVAFERAFLAAHDRAMRGAVGRYTLLSLARLIHVSTVISDRRPWTPALVSLCSVALAEPGVPDVRTLFGRAQEIPCR